MNLLLIGYTPERFIALGIICMFLCGIAIAAFLHIIYTKHRNK